MNNIVFAISICAALCFGSCGNTGNARKLNDTGESAAQEKWTRAVPDTAMLRKTCAVVEITTNYGVLQVALFNATPKHRDNFLKLAGDGFYNQLLFHRIKKSFMVQAGDPNSKNPKIMDEWGKGGPGYSLPAEIIDTFYHYRGALCAARLADEINPKKESSGSQFYIITGSLFNTTALKSAISDRLLIQFLDNPENLSYNMRLQKYQRTQNRPAMENLIAEMKSKLDPVTDSLYHNLPARVRQLYATWGGFPALDKEYTIFGFVIAGYDVLDKLENIETDRDQHPKQAVQILKTRIIKNFEK
jgi:cyclophilin family peptidyl-prolyl cis-trans isomerase